MRQRTFLTLIALGFAVGCARAPAPRGIDVYRGLSERLPRLDPSGLRGRRILIDPGHGGYFTGTRGHGGLDEAGVNLGVALYLWGLLREAGADAHLTRSAGRDFLSTTDSTVAADLRRRVSMVDSLRPDILVSIHHNAQNDRDPDKNLVETYYRFGDPASRDLAFAVHRHLMRNLGIEDGVVRPGNYFILRNVAVPAILGEGSYLTHPGVEKRLKLSDKQRLEAEAYFLGILEYFSRGTPRIERLGPPDSVFVDVPTLAFAVRDSGGVGIDPDDIEIQVNGRLVTAYLSADGRTIRYRPSWDAPNGPYRLSLRVRNLLGNSSPVRTIHFRIDLPPEIATFTPVPASLPTAGGIVRIRARLLDRRGQSIADGTPVTLRTTAGAVPKAALVRHGFVEFPLTVSPGTRNVTLTLSARGRGFDLAMQGAIETRPAFRRITVLDGRTGVPVAHATVVRGDSLISGGSASGLYFIPQATSGDHPLRVRAAGYRPAFVPAADGLSSDTLRLTPWYNGRLLGARFVLDPEGGFGAGPGMGRLGLSGAFVNLRTAQYLKQYLETSGADVLITRRTEAVLSPRDAVAATNRFGADRYIEIRHRNAPTDSGLAAEAYFFPGSRTGEDMAEDIQNALSHYLDLPRRHARELVTFPLQQTACPAIVVELPSIGVVDEELRLGEPWYQRRQAYGLFLGILSHYAADSTAALTVTVRDSLPANWYVTVDGTWSLLTGPDGKAVFQGLPPGNGYHVVARRGPAAIAAGIVDLPPGSDRILEIRVLQTP